MRQRNVKPLSTVHRRAAPSSALRSAGLTLNARELGPHMHQQHPSNHVHFHQPSSNPRAAVLAGGDDESCPEHVSIPVWSQGSGDLSERMERAIRRALTETPRVVALGTDSPGLSPKLIRKALDALETCDAVIGPADDGEIPPSLAVPASIVVLDLGISLQHLMLHSVPIFWRLHMVHHTDLDFDVTTGLRFHPVEILLNASSMFNHGHVSLPATLDRALRWVVVTPDMHRVHHSIEHNEANSNFGFGLSWWDRLLGTYRAQPAAEHDQMQIGVRGLQERRLQGLRWMILLPFRRNLGSATSNRGQRA